MSWCLHGKHDFGSCLAVVVMMEVLQATMTWILAFLVKVVVVVKELVYVTMTWILGEGEGVGDQTWNLSKILHRRIFRPKILHRQFQQF